MISRKMLVIIILVIIIGSILAYLSYIFVTPRPTQEPFKIGIVLPLTGPYAAEARSQLEGIRLAVEEINARGGILGHPIEIYWRDDELKPEVGRVKVEELIESVKVHVIFGHLHAGMALMTNEYAKERKFWFFAMSMQTEKFNMKDVIGPYSFRYFMSTPECARTVATYLITTLGAKRIYIVAADYAYGWSLRDQWIKVAEEHGVQIVGIDLVPVGTTDFSSYITKILAAKPDIVASLNFGSDFVNFVKQAHAYGLDKLGIKIATASITLSMARGAGPEAMQNVYGCIQYYYEVENLIPEAKEFNEKFIKYFGYPPDSYAEAAYSITLIVSQALEKSGEWPPNLDKIVDIIMKETFVTAKGPVKFDKARNVIQPLIIIKGKEPAKIIGEYDLFEIVKMFTIDEAVKYIPPPSYYGY